MSAPVRDRAAAFVTRWLAWDRSDLWVAAPRLKPLILLPVCVQLPAERGFILVGLFPTTEATISDLVVVKVDLT